MHSRSKLVGSATLLLFLGSLGTAHGVPPGWTEPNSCSFECWFKGYLLTATEHPLGGSWTLSLEGRHAKEYADSRRRAHLLSKYDGFAQDTLIKERLIRGEDVYCDYQGYWITQGPVFLVEYPSPFEIVPGVGGGGPTVCGDRETVHLTTLYNQGKPLKEWAPPCPLGAGGCLEIQLPPSDEPHKEGPWGSRGPLSPEYSNWNEVPKKELPDYFPPLKTDTGKSENDEDEDPKQPSSQTSTGPMGTERDGFKVMERREPKVPQKDSASRALQGEDARSSFCRSGKSAGVGPLHYPAANSCIETSKEVGSAVTGFHFRRACATDYGGQVPERVPGVRVDRCLSADRVAGFDGGVVVEATVCCQ